MGCDIHLYKEKHVDGKWLAADEWVDDNYEPGRKDVPWEKRFTERNYQLFGLLSKGVREDHQFAFVTRGIPFDACAEIVAEADRWGRDGHSHNYLFLHELKSMQSFLETAKITVTGMKDKDEIKALNDSVESGNPNLDLLFPYCRSSNAPSYEDFSIEVPASFYVGASIQRIIDSFDGIEGDNHRVVFFFDN